MRQLVESLKRLYETKKIDSGHVIDMYKRGIINENDKNYILGKEE